MLTRNREAWNNEKAETMKKFLPLILFLIGVIVVVTAFFLVKGRKRQPAEDMGGVALLELPLTQRPIASLTPSEDGHWLKFKVEKIVIDAVSLDYELLYKLPDGRTQGVPGTIKLERQKEIERDLLLGSESSGKFRYDEGVENGTFTLRFRDEKGRLVAKFLTEFHLQSGGNALSSVDGAFKYTLNKSSDAFFVTMGTFGLPEEPPGDLFAGPYGIFSSLGEGNTGVVDLAGGRMFRWESGRWEELTNSNSASLGIFISTLE